MDSVQQCWKVELNKTRKARQDENQTRPRLTAILFGGRGGDGKTIVATEKDDRTVESGGKIETGMKVTLRCSTFTKIAEAGAAFAFQLQAVRRTGGLRDLRGQRRRDGLQADGTRAVVDGHLTALAGVTHVAEALIGEVGQAKAAPQ
jgi:hypothetical protein